VSGPERADFTPPPDLVEHLIRKHHLRDERGVVMCWFCKYRPALLPSLACQGCLDTRRGKRAAPAR